MSKRSDRLTHIAKNQANKIGAVLGNGCGVTPLKTTPECLKEWENKKVEYTPEHLAKVSEMANLWGGVLKVYNPVYVRSQHVGQ